MAMTGKWSGFEVRSSSGNHGEAHGKHADARREAETIAALGERFVFVYHRRGLGVVEILPFCPAPGDAIAPNGGKCCGRGDIRGGLYCPDHLVSHHPEPQSIPCPDCGAGQGMDCVVTFGSDRVRQTRLDGTPWVMLWCHEERHQAAIAVDGRTCAVFGEPAPDPAPLVTIRPRKVVNAWQTTLW